MVFIFHKPEKSNTNLVFMFHTCFQMSFMFEATSCLPRTSQCSNKEDSRINHGNQQAVSWKWVFWLWLPWW